MKQQASSMPSTGPGAWKWQYRKSMWDRMEAEDIARCELEAYKCKLACSNVHPLWYVPVQTFVQAPASRKLLLEGSEWHRKSEMFPRPVHHRIPNFVGADAAALKLASLPEFQRAQCMKVNPDTPQKPVGCCPGGCILSSLPELQGLAKSLEQKTSDGQCELITSTLRVGKQHRNVRYHVLSSGKTLLTPQPRLRTGFFSTLQFREEDKAKIGQATSSAGVAQYGVPVNLDSKIKVSQLNEVNCPCASISTEQQALCNFCVSDEESACVADFTAADHGAAIQTAAG
eukprot:1151772-Pelagomonas_calceolata.AAC.1